MKFIVKQGKSEKDIKNLRQEIEILRHLRHENIIQMLDAFETKDHFVVVMGELSGALLQFGRHRRLARRRRLLNGAAASIGTARPRWRLVWGSAARTASDGDCVCACACREPGLRPRGFGVNERRAHARRGQHRRCRLQCDAHRVLRASLPPLAPEFAQGELFEVLEDDQSLPEEVVQNVAKQLVRRVPSCLPRHLIPRMERPGRSRAGSSAPDAGQEAG
jgi:hypothetical protein